MTPVIYVALGGAVGAAARYYAGAVVAFPFGTIAVNVAGCFLMGLAFVFMAEKGMERWMPLVMTGILGGFTTFSAFSLDTLRLYEAGRIGAAGGYVVGSVVFSVLALFAGVMIMRASQG